MMVQLSVEHVFECLMSVVMALLMLVYRNDRKAAADQRDSDRKAHESLRASDLAAASAARASDLTTAVAARQADERTWQALRDHLNSLEARELARDKQMVEITTQQTRHEERSAESARSITRLESDIKEIKSGMQELLARVHTEGD